MSKKKAKVLVRMGPVMGDRNGNTSKAYTYKGFLTEDNCAHLVNIKKDPLSDFYDIESRPFARYESIIHLNVSFYHYNNKTAIKTIVIIMNSILQYLVITIIVITISVITIIELLLLLLLYYY